MTEPYVAPASSPIPRTGFGDPATLALIAFPLALLCLSGSDELSGIAYTVPFARDLGSSAAGTQGVLFGGHVLSVLFALVPYVLARRGLSRLVSTDAWWIVPVLRATVVLAVIAMTLRLAATLLVLVDDSYGLSPFFVTRR